MKGDVESDEDWLTIRLDELGWRAIHFMGREVENLKPNRTDQTKTEDQKIKKKKEEKKKGQRQTKRKKGNPRLGKDGKPTWCQSVSPTLTRRAREPVRPGFRWVSWALDQSTGKTQIRDTRVGPGTRAGRTCTQSNLSPVGQRLFKLQSSISYHGMQL